MSTTNKFQNALVHETSPYLLQHAHNPVNWYPWGDEAFALAKKENKPIFLSIGYSACHWCHVMERESFEDETTAKILNEHFVSIKVDREERPDVDDIYMKAVIALTQRGGWPMSVFLNHDKLPFYGGTYFPPTPRYGMPSFTELLHHLADNWKNKKENIGLDAERLHKHIKKQLESTAPGELSEDILTPLAKQCLESFEEHYGGFSQAPKFFHSEYLKVLLLDHKINHNKEALEAVHFTLERIARGGIHDQVAGGIHRYSVDMEWLVPHFEKMLYDQALLLEAYVDISAQSHDPLMISMVNSIADFVTREFLSEEGLFFTASDADADGEEGTFFTWTPEEMQKALGDDAAKASLIFGMDQHPNFEGRTILTRNYNDKQIAEQLELTIEEFETERQRLGKRLREVRAQRIAPDIDDKILCDWNGLMIAALAKAAAFTGNKHYKNTAINALKAIRKHLIPEKKLQRTRRNKKTHLTPVLSDYVYLAKGALEVFCLTGLSEELHFAESLMEEAVREHGREGSQALATARKNNVDLIVDAYEVQDGALPAANGIAADNLYRLGLLLNRNDFTQRAQGIVSSFAQAIEKYPRIFSSLCLAEIRARHQNTVIILNGPEGNTLDEMYLLAKQSFLGLTEVIKNPDSDIGYFAGKSKSPEIVQAWICTGQSCQAPIDNLEDFKRAIGA